VFLFNSFFQFEKATVAKIILEMLPEDIGCSVESRDLIVDCCVGQSPLAPPPPAPLSYSNDYSFVSHFVSPGINEEFIHLLASESNDVLEEEKKKTMGGEHVLRALEVRLSYLKYYYKVIPWIHHGFALDSPWIRLGSYGFIWVHMGSYGFIWVHMGSVGFTWIQLEYSFWIIHLEPMLFLSFFLLLGLCLVETWIRRLR